jgi:4,5-dihydroxyphthalate decarboxylase
MTGSPVHLTLAISDYDHVRDLAAGRVRPEGLDLTVLTLQVEEIFYRFTLHEEWDVSELSLAKYASLASQGDSPFVAIPVFPSRVFRHSALYVRADSGLHDPRQLAGRRVGVPEWAQTAGIYVRGFLEHEFGVRTHDVDWFQAGVNEPGRVEKVDLRLPEGVRLTPVPDRSLDGMLTAGDLDAVASARPPRSFLDGDSVVRLFPDARAAEEASLRATGVFPIMHLVAIRRPVFERYPWVAGELLKAFDEARRRSVERLGDAVASRVPAPWAAYHAAAMRELFGGEPWQYGLEPNRTTLEAFLRWAYEQGCCHRLLCPDDLFPEAVVGSTFKV